MRSAPRPRTHVRHAPVTPGKVAMWLFLATEVMFFTGLIGSYIVLRAGSPHAAYSNLYPPATPLKGLENTHGVLLEVGRADNHEQVEHVLHTVAGLDRGTGRGSGRRGASRPRRAGSRRKRPRRWSRQLKSAGADAEDEPLEDLQWPLPYDELTNPLAINLTAVNTFILICSSVTMVLALAAIQDGKKGQGLVFLAGHRPDRHRRS